MIINLWAISKGQRDVVMKNKLLPVKLNLFQRDSRFCYKYFQGLKAPLHCRMSVPSKQVQQAILHLCDPSGTKPPDKTFLILKKDGREKEKELGTNSCPTVVSGEIPSNHPARVLFTKTSAVGEIPGKGPALTASLNICISKQ